LYDLRAAFGTPLCGSVVLGLRLPPVVDNNAVVGAALVGLTPCHARFSGRAVRTSLLSGTVYRSFHEKKTSACGGSFHGTMNSMEPLRVLER